MSSLSQESIIKKRAANYKYGNNLEINFRDIIRQVHIYFLIVNLFYLCLYLFNIIIYISLLLEV